jgi:hypothetical protein
VGPVWVKFNVLSGVKEFVKNPAVNFGLLVINTAGAQEIDFISSENTKSDLRPKLTVSYSAPAIIKSPVVAGGAPSGLKISARHRAVLMEGSGISSPVEVTVYRPDGKRLSRGLVEPGARRQLTGPGAGVCLITIRDHTRQRYIVAPFVP